MQYQRIVVIGDSVVFGRVDPSNGGWVGRVRREWTERDPGANAVFNLGIGGETSRGLRGRLVSECRPRNPDLIVIGVGVNDSREAADRTKREVDIGEFEDNVSWLITAARDLATVVWMGMVPVDDKRTSPIGSLYYSSSVQEDYHRVTVEQCQSHGVEMVDVWGAWSRLPPDDGQRMLWDGLHPDAKGHAMIADLFTKTVLDHA